MARIRTIKPTFFTSLDLANTSDAAKLLLIGLWTYCDDYGRAIDDVRLIKAAVFPLDAKKTERVIDRLLAELVAGGRIVRYDVDGRNYLFVPNWSAHQRVDRRTDSNIPAPQFDEDAASVQRGLDEGSLQEGKGREGKGTYSSSETTSTDAPPELDDDDRTVVAACRLIAEARLQRRLAELGPVAAEDRWLASAALKAKDRYRTQALDLLASRRGLTPADLAALLEPPAPIRLDPAAATQEAQEAQRRLLERAGKPRCEACVNGWVEVDDGTVIACEACSGTGVLEVAS